jgi:hypothetical protein
MDAIYLSCHQWDYFMELLLTSVLLPWWGLVRTFPHNLLYAPAASFTGMGTMHPFSANRIYAIWILFFVKPLRCQSCSTSLNQISNIFGWKLVFQLSKGNYKNFESSFAMSFTNCWLIDVIQFFQNEVIATHNTATTIPLAT